MKYMALLSTTANLADKIVDLIYLKYLKAKITYEHDRRVETYPFARNAIREAIYNAIAHNCYMYGTPIQIRTLKSALIEEPKTPNRQDVGKDVGLEVGLAKMIIALISEKSDVTMAEMAERLGVTTRTIERQMKKLRESERVLRVGGKRYGHWEVKDAGDGKFK